MTHARGLLENFGHAMLELHRLQLIAKIRDHPTGDLMLVERRIVRRHLAARLVLALAQIIEIARHFVQRGEIETRAPAFRARDRLDLFGRRQRRAVRKRTNGRMSQCESAFDRDSVDIRRKP